jgi:hypothetical protein
MVEDRQMMRSGAINRYGSLSVLAMLGPLALAGCGLFPWTRSDSEAPRAAAPPGTAKNTPRVERKHLTLEETKEELRLNDGFALLYDLMDKESGVDKILVLRSASAPTQEIIRRIAKECAAAKEHLDSLAKANSLLRLDYQDLPRAEVDTRKAIEWATTKKLLFGVGFELKLILTQVSATEYAAFLAESLAARDRDEERKAWLGEAAERFKGLHQEIVQRLAVKP